MKQRQCEPWVTVDSVFRTSSVLLASITWLSSALFGAYILIFYAGALLAGQARKWNQVLPGLHDATQPVSTLSIGLHFMAGGMILAFGFIQLIERIRVRAPAVHRWLGRIYVASALLAGVGGLLFILITGTIGGKLMDVGFGLYGALMIWAAAQTYRHARQRRIEAHRAWAIRLFALAIGSWLYRMEYGLWVVLTHRLGHTSDFQGWFDIVMAFFFYVPNLLVAEAYLYGRSERIGNTGRAWATVGMAMASGLLLVATYFFAVRFWWPSIAEA